MIHGNRIVLGAYGGDSELYPFTTFTFTSAGATGKDGPTSVQLSTAYSAEVWYADYFTNLSGIQYWTVPSSGNYTIETFGASGGGGSYLGGFGSRMKGTFALTTGMILKMLVGQTGGPSYGGGGGGTFVATDTNIPLIVSGGGNTLSAWSAIPSHAPTTTSGLNSSSGGIGGTLGSGGTGYNGSPGGAGFTGNGGVATCQVSVPLSFINGGTGSTSCNSIGGFGGGSASDGCCYGQSGPGGGYSGGGAGSGGSTYGGAGGSYNSGTSQSNDAGNTGTAILVGNGKIIITKL